MTDVPTPPDEIPPDRKAYAFERSLGIPLAESCRRAGGNPKNGVATKWERDSGVMAWIAYYRSQDHTDRMRAEKRFRVEGALNSIAYGDGSDFQNKGKQRPMIDWPHRLNALAQLRDMHGFKAAAKTELSGPAGASINFTDEDRAKALMLLIARIDASAKTAE